MNKLDIKVGEIWEVFGDCDDSESSSYNDKEIIYVADEVIAAVGILSSDRKRHVYVYDQFGEPKGAYYGKLKRRKPEKKVIEYNRYMGLMFDGTDSAWLAGTYVYKEPRIERDSRFIKWIEIKESFEVEV